MLLPLLAFSSLATTSPASQDFETGPVPDWVEPAGIEELSGLPVDQIEGGLYVVLSDAQDRFADGSVSAFRDYAWYVHNTQGVQAGSHVGIDFDPAYQRLTIHAIEVIRGDRVIDRLDPERIEVLQREEDLEYQVYDGALTALLFLEDVRPGDVVRHAYTLEGSNPALAGHYVRTISLQSQYPVGRIRFRLLWPADRPLEVRASDPGIRPGVTEREGTSDYRWDATGVPGMSIEHPLPSWYYPLPWIQLTDFRDWNEVARWGAELFETPDAVGSELAALIDSIREASESPFDRALASTRFVQDEIRYLGIELGGGAYVASRPDEVHARRFGDCKDKSLLLSTMLRELGIGSRPGLVSTELVHTIPDFAPSPLLFDHVIVRIDLPGGPYWVDPTESLVGGDLRSQEPPPLSLALVADASSTGLERIPEHGRPALTRICYEIDARELDSPGELEVVTRYEGRDADDFRGQFGWTTPERYGQRCLEYYGAWYESLRAFAPVEVLDDREENVVTTTERYEVADLWTEYDGELWLELYALEMDELLPTLSSDSSDHPIAIPHPVRYEHTIEVRLGEGEWDLQPESEVVDDGGFLFTYDSDFDRATNVLSIDYTLRSKADHVPGAATAGYLDDVDRVSELLAYDVYHDDGEWRLVLLAAGALLVGLVAVGSLTTFVAVRSHLLRKDRSWSELVAEASESSPWFTMWTRPRATMRAILDDDPTHWVVLLAAAAGILNALDNASFRSLGDHFSLAQVILFSIVGGALGGVVSMYVAGLVLAPIGRMLGGRGKSEGVRSAFAWSSVVPIWFGALWIPDLLLFGEEMFTTEMPRTESEPVLWVVFVALGAIELLGGVWGVVVFLKCLAEAHRFSTWRALATVALALTGFVAVVVVLALAIGLPAYLLSR